MSNINYTVISNEELLDEINKFNVSLRCLDRYLKHNNQELYDELLSRTKFLYGTSYLENEKLPIACRLYCLKNNLSSPPICANPSCNNFVKWGSASFLTYCCSKCHNSDPNMGEIVRNAFLKKYGVDNIFQLDETKDKIRQTMLEHHGVEHALQSKEIKKRQEQTCLDRYGVENPAELKEFQEKAFNTKLSIYGDGNFNNTEQIKNTCLDRYGVDNVTKLESTKIKMKNTCVERYGVESYSQTENFKERFIQTSLIKYEVSHPTKCKEIKNRISETNIETLWNKLNSHERTTIPMFSKDECQLVSSSKKYNWKCKKCGTKFESEISGNWWKVSNHSDYARCPVCHPYMDVSSGAEHDISNFIQTIWQNVVENDRTVLNGKEIDIYIPDRKLAFEYDGLYWHSESNGKNEKYHIHKTNECEKQGIHLIHIFENEWMNKREIVESRIKNLLGVYDKTVYARKCEVKEVSSTESFEFQNVNHIQGGVHSKVNLGLYYGDELISLMTFSRPRFNKDCEWELVRFCNKLGYHIPGGASRLLKYFERNYNPKSIISYADRRWSNGNLYGKLGFKLNSISSPNYWYFNNDRILESRVKYQKHKLKNMLPIFDESKSEVQNMLDNGYHRIFDCGNLVFVKSN